MNIVLKDSEISFEEFNQLFRDVFYNHDGEMVLCNSFEEFTSAMKKRWPDAFDEYGGINYTIALSVQEKSFEDFIIYFLTSPGVKAYKFDYSREYGWPDEKNAGWELAAYAKQVRYKKAGLKEIINCDQIVYANRLDEYVLTRLNSVEKRYLAGVLFREEPNKKAIVFKNNEDVWCLTRDYPEY